MVIKKVPKVPKMPIVPKVKGPENQPPWERLSPLIIAAGKPLPH
jgi:hypothetical protein